MNQLSILICSSDRYHSLWNLHYDYLKKYWPNCPYQVYLGSDSLIYEKISTLICKQKGLSWSSCLIEWLTQIDSEYVLMTLDDFILRHPINTLDIERCLNFIVQRNVDCIRLVARPKPFYPDVDDHLFGQYDPVMPYLVSLQASIWNKKSLISLLREGESIWEFEQYGTIRAREKIELKFYGVYKTVFNYGEHIIDGGTLLRTSTYNLPIKKYNLTFPTISFKVELIILIKRIWHFIVYRSPLPLRLIIIKQLINRLKTNTIQQKTDAINQQKT